MFCVIKEKIVDNFAVLEQKVALLIDIIKNLKTENSRLVQENTHLNEQILTMQEAMMTDAKNADNLSQEKAVASLVVDEIIKNIDSIINTEKQL